MSSVFKGLSATRVKVHGLLERQGYSVIWAEGMSWPERPTPQLTAMMCLAGIDGSDYYLGIYPSRYGSDPLGMGYTELEYHHAANRRMPRFLYQLYDHVAESEDQRIKQRGFVNLLRDPDVSPVRPVRYQSVRSLLDAIERDFSELAPCGTHAQPRPDVGLALRLWTASSSSISVGSPNDLWAARERELQQAACLSVTYAKAVGVAHLLQSTSEFDTQDIRFIRGFDEYLRAWIGVSAWAGVQGVFGQANIAKVRISLAQLQGRYEEISYLAGNVASGLYSDRRVAAADRWYQVFRRSGEVPSMEGPIALARGDAALASSCFERVLAGPDLDDAGAALHLGYYGVALAMNGHLREAIRESEAALMLPGLPATTSTRVWRTRAQTLAIAGDSSGAKEAVEMSERIAMAAGLLSQIQKARKLKSQLLRRR